MIGQKNEKKNLFDNLEVWFLTNLLFSSYTFMYEYSVSFKYCSKRKYAIIKAYWFNLEPCCNTKCQVAYLLVMHLIFLKSPTIFLRVILCILWFPTYLSIIKPVGIFITSKQMGNGVWKLANTHNKGYNNTLICNITTFTFTRNNYETLLHVSWNTIYHICLLRNM